MALDRTLPHPMLIFLTPDRKQLSIHDVTIGEAGRVGCNAPLLRSRIRFMSSSDCASSSSSRVSMMVVHGARSAAERARVIEALSKAFAAPEPDLEAARNSRIRFMSSSDCASSSSSRVSMMVMSRSGSVTGSASPKLKLLSPWLFVHGARSAAERARVIEALSKAFAAPGVDSRPARRRPLRS
jgi:hypothetical protein